MKLPENDYQILKLTDSFYQHYPNPPYKEMLKKQKRAYNCLLFQTHYNYFICIPYRSEITHSNAYLFRKSNRSKKHKSGLDYTKILIIVKQNILTIKAHLLTKMSIRKLSKTWKKSSVKR
jgi:protein AbiQ